MTVSANHRRPGGLPARRRGESGFTVSELVLVAVFVVGLLVVALSSASGIKRDTRISDCQSELRNLKLAVAQYEAAKGSFPTAVRVVVRAGYAEPDAVAGWDITGGGGDAEPTYAPASGRC